jgi:hypothetical protein
MRERSRDTMGFLWTERVEPEIGHYYIEEVTTEVLDDFKLTLKKKYPQLGPASEREHAF